MQSFIRYDGYAQPRQKGLDSRGGRPHAALEGRDGAKPRHHTGTKQKPSVFADGLKTLPNFVRLAGEGRPPYKR
jgi:hypothetical protein